jgi:glycosyltransferase involved in cell wall biosynthesis
MTSIDAVIAHLLTADTPALKLDVLRELASLPDPATRQVVYAVGPGPVPTPAIRVHAPAPMSWLATGALRHQLKREGVLAGDRPVIMHAWSPDAARWCHPLVATHRPLLVEVEPADDLRPLAAGCFPGPVGFVCPSQTVRQQLLDLGVAEPRCVLVHPLVDPAALDPARRAEARDRLGIGENQVAVTALPPVARRSGTFVATWAALLLEKARPDVRLVIPSDGGERQRVRRLVEACRHERMVRFAAPDLSLPDLLVATDLAAWLPSRDSSPASLAWAMAAGLPIVATAAAAVRELLADDPMTWLCRPDDPEDAARQMNRALEQPAQPAQRIVQARARRLEAFSRPEVVSRYRCVYANLATRRPAGAGLLDPAQH